MANTELSRIIARAVFAAIERDRVCNLANIEEAVFRELAVAEARLRETGAPAPGLVSTRLHNAGLSLLSEIRSHILTGTWNCFDDAVIELQNALKEAGAL
jgi:hypothetical protein